MTEHWCSKHKTAWFKKGKMKGFAHPIVDDETGEPTGEWCNEPKDETAPQAASKPAYGQDSPEKRRSIERQTAIQITTQLEIAAGGKVTMAELLQEAETIYQWIANGTMPQEATKPPAQPKDTTPATKTPPSRPSPRESKPVEDLWAEEKGITPESVSAAMSQAIKAGQMTLPQCKALFNLYAAIGDSTLACLRSLSPENLAQVNKEVQAKLNEVSS